MIASWMMYTFAVSALLFVAGAALEWAAAAQGWSRRYVWGAMIALSFAWPAFNLARRVSTASLPAVRLAPFTITVQPPPIVRPAIVDRAALVDRVLLGVWALWSILLLARLGVGTLRLRRARRRWRQSHLDGRAVQLSKNEGPAVVGLWSMDVVLPEWIESLDAPLRAIVLRHEEEHRTARDPYLLFGAATAVALMPWNLALWLHARRLRFAVELDCDARVLRAHPSPERYGLLMLTIAQRRASAPSAFAPMMSEPTTQIERRIIAMRSTTRRLGRVTMAGAGFVGLAALLFACSLQSDDPTSPRPAVIGPKAAYLEYQVEQAVRPGPGAVAPLYPSVLRRAGVEGEVLAEFVVDTTGRPDMSTLRVVRSSHDLFTAAVRNALSASTFVPAEIGAKKVRQFVQMPFKFSLTGPGQTSSVISSTATGPTGSAARTPLPAISAAKAPQKPNNGKYVEFIVSKPATPMPGNRAPRYPDLLRQAKIEGTVLAQFVVDTTGYPIPSTLKILQSSHDLFTQAVRNNLDSLRFYPAQVSNHKVKQLIEMPFQFNLAKEP